MLNITQDHYIAYTFLGFVGSILCIFPITPRSDADSINMPLMQSVVLIGRLSHITVTDNQIINSTSGIVYFHTVDNAWINVSAYLRAGAIIERRF